jgi:hypothetical protein
MRDYFGETFKPGWGRKDDAEVERKDTESVGSRSRETVKYWNDWNQESLCCPGPAAVHQIGGLVSRDSWYGTVAGCCEHGNAPSGCIHGGRSLTSWASIIISRRIIHNAAVHCSLCIQFSFSYQNMLIRTGMSRYRDATGLDCRGSIPCKGKGFFFFCKLSTSVLGPT